MRKRSAYIKNIAITLGILCLSFAIGLLLQTIFNVQATIPTVFVFAVFLVSLLTDGYVYGIIAAFIIDLPTSLSFTVPYFKINFTIPENIFSALIMVSIALVTSTLTAKIKYQDTIRVESEKERMRANLLRAISHDLRTPLTTIYGSSSAILENYNSFSEEQKIQMIQGIKEDSEWLVHMVENLLSITKIDSGNVKIIKTPIALDELIDSVLQKFKKRYPYQKIDLDIPDNVVVIPMDPLLIEQVIINILENSVQHAKGMTRLSLRVFTMANLAIFEISDNGCGIDKERIDKLFSEYSVSGEQQADSKRSNAGIGLSVCATIIKAHGGEIYAGNIKNGGTVIRFSLHMEETDDE